MNALSAARSLWRMGVPVDVLAGSNPVTPVRWSRCTRNFVTAGSGDPTNDWRDWLARAEPSVILPCSDEGLELVARHRSEIEEHGHRAVEADDEVLLAMLDKSRTYTLARQVGVPAPATRTLSSTADLADLDGFLFPCAIKPVESHVFVRRFRPAAKGALVASREEAVELLRPILEEGVAMLLTEVVEGTDECCSYYSYLDEDGTPLTHFTKRKLRQYPTRFGLGTYHMTRWQPDVAELGLRFFQGVGLRGVGNVEFKRDARDGQLKLIECNPRFTNAHELVSRSGIDFGRLAYARLTGRPLPPLEHYRENLGLWFPLDDLRALRSYRADGELTSGAWLRSLAHRQVPPYLDPTDPGPSLVNAARFARAAARRVARAARDGSGALSTSPADRYVP
jgi:D-aspartate ligase